jgi:hypothetical protein
VKIFKSIHISRSYLVGFLCFILWFLGIIFTTSYYQLLPIWIFLGIMMNYNKVIHTYNKKEF